MVSHNPLARLDPDTQARWLRALAVAFVVLAIVLGVLGQPLVTPAAPFGIVSFELAGSAARVEEILDSWSNRARGSALLLQGLDYLFLLVYPALLSLGCLAVARRREGGAAVAFGAAAARAGRARAVVSRATWPPRDRVAVLGAGIAFAVLAAAPLDGIENYCLIRLMAEAPTDRWAAFAWWAAVGKFAVVTVAILYVAIAPLLPRRPR